VAFGGLPWFKAPQDDKPGRTMARARALAAYHAARIALASAQGAVMGIR
jgi:hypothetical protein